RHCLRYFTEYNISNRLLFSASMTGNMESIWEMGNFSFPYYTVNDWLYQALRNANLRVVFPDNVLSRYDAFQFFNDTIIPNL
uniref:hypothetical protein n=1 Tax=Xenorhabdus sp. GDc328 TaxID=742178 RepID=UPI000AE653E4